MTGLSWKRNAAEVLERRRRFFAREMLDGILATLPVRVEPGGEPDPGSPRVLQENPGLPVDLGAESEWRAFEKRWPGGADSEERDFPSNDEILERIVIGEEARGRVEDDYLPVLYSILDAGEGMIGALLGVPVRFFGRARSAAFSKSETMLPDYSGLDELRFSLESRWARRFLEVQEHVRDRAAGRFGQFPCISIDALNFACELRGATAAYLDVYEHPEELRRLMDLGLDFNVRFQEAQMERCGGGAGGGFNMLAQWAPFPGMITMGVDAYVICSTETYAEFGFEHQKRLAEHFGHAAMHFHCNRTDLAAEVARLPGLELFQFGGDTRDPLPTVDRIPEMRQAVGDVPMQVFVALESFRERLAGGTLAPNVWYIVDGPGLSVDEANRLMDRVRAYQA
ncbi:MAG: uroporphyrinogen decarboxylase/cobalamine-independent methonine synthase family protein [Planctomycetota bacterium]